MHSDNLRLTSVLRVLGRGCDLAAAFSELIGTRSPAAFDTSLKLLKNEPYLIACIDALHRTAIRAAVTEAFETAKDYSKSTGQFEHFKEQPWFDVFRLLRNGLNHNFRLQFTPKDKTLLPLVWMTIELRPEHESMEIGEDVLSTETAIAWLSALDTFVEYQLS